MNPLATALFGGDDLLGQALRWLAAAGAGLVGGFVIGLATQAISGMLAAQKMPVPVLWFVRVLGGIACGLLMYFYFALGGNGTGGPGPGGGEKDAVKDGTKDAVKDQTRDSSKEKQTEKERTPKPEDVKKFETLKVEIVDRAAFNTLRTAEDVRQKRYYRLPDLDGQLRSLIDICGILDKQDPPVRKVVVIQYVEGWPDGDFRVDDLKDALRARAGKISRGDDITRPGSALDFPPPGSSP